MTTAAEADIISSFTFSVANNVSTGSQITLTQNLAEHQESLKADLHTHCVSHRSLPIGSLVSRNQGGCGSRFLCKGHLKGGYC